MTGPLSVAEQLQRLRDEYAQHSNPDPLAGPAPRTQPLYDQWRTLEEHSPAIRNCLPAIIRGGVHVDHPPLHEAMLYVEGGLYPPPELLIVIAETYRRYLDAHGRLDLETAMFGRLRHNVGNFSGQHESRIRTDHMAARIGVEMNRGATKAEAAAVVASSGFPIERLKRLSIPGHRILDRNDRARRRAPPRPPAHAGQTWAEMVRQIGA